MAGSKAHRACMLILKAEFCNPVMLEFSGGRSSSKVSGCSKQIIRTRVNGMVKLLVRITLLKLLVRIEFSTVCAFDACAVQYSAPWLPAKLFIDVTDSMWQPSQAAATAYS